MAFIAPGDVHFQAISDETDEDRHRVILSSLPSRKRQIDGRTFVSLGESVVAMNTNTILNELIETLKDGQEGFRSAAENVESTDLKSLLLEYSLQRGRFATELQSLARVEGEHDPADSGSIAGALHRGWINLKAALSTKDDHAVLTECERGEDSAVAQYEKALAETGLPSHVTSIVREQYIRIKAAHDRIRDLRDSLVVAK